MDDLESIPLSALQHYLYCPRQCALIHLERIWTESRETAEGRLLHERSDCVMSTVAHAIDDAAEYANPNVVKVVCDAAGRALYFSRASIPHWRDRPGATALSTPPPLRHVGLYAYRAAFLRRFPALPHAPLEGLESLEQLRVLWHGERIAVHVSNDRPGPGVDTPADLERVRAIWPGL